MKLAVVVVGGCALVGMASAQAAQSDFVEGFKVETVTEVLRAEKATDFSNETVENEPRLKFKVGDTNMVADFYSCDDKVKGCKALQFMVTYEPDSSDTIQAVNAFNVSYLYGKAAIDTANGSPLVSYRLVNGHAGSSKGQIAAEFKAFLGVTAVLLDHMKKSTVTAQAAGEKPAMLNTSADSVGVSAQSRWRSLPRNRRP